jgi:hypothetical protein
MAPRWSPNSCIGDQFIGKPDEQDVRLENRVRKPVDVAPRLAFAL